MQGECLEEEDKPKRPVVWFAELVISLPFDSVFGATESATP